MNEWVICFWIGLALLVGIPVFGLFRTCDEGLGKLRLSSAETVTFLP